MDGKGIFFSPDVNPETEIVSIIRKAANSDEANERKKYKHVRRIGHNGARNEVRRVVFHVKIETILPNAGTCQNVS